MATVFPSLAKQGEKTSTLHGQELAALGPSGKHEERGEQMQGMQAPKLAPYSPLVKEALTKASTEVCIALEEAVFARGLAKLAAVLLAMELR